MTAFLQTAHDLDVRNLKAELKDAEHDHQHAAMLFAQAARLGRDTTDPKAQLRRALERFLDVVQRLELKRTEAPRVLTADAGTKHEYTPPREHDRKLHELQRERESHVKDIGLANLIARLDAPE